MKELDYGEIIILIGSTGTHSIVTIHSIIDEDAQWNHEVVVELVKSGEYELNDSFLGMLRHLLSDDRVMMDDIKKHLFPTD